MFLGCTLLGAVWQGNSLWQLVDLCSALMALPNLTALLFLAPQALGDLRRWQTGRKPKKMEKPY